MPITSQGTTVSFNGATIGKVVGVNGSFATALKEIRELATNLDAATGQYLSIYEQTTCEQTIELEVIADSFDLSVIGTKGPLIVGGAAWSMSFGAAFCENMKVTAKVADFLRINYAFKRSFY